MTTNNSDENYNILPKLPIFFYSHNDINLGYLSQFFNAPIKYKRRTYNCCEQWMMAWKARLFKDRKTLELIMAETNPTKIKALGRKVRNFDQEQWEQYRYSIVKRGNLLKFQQNPLIAKLLIKTGDRQLVEASARDRIYGIGCSVASSPTYPKEKWGLNLLGKALMSVRKCIKN